MMMVVGMKRIVVWLSALMLTGCVHQQMQSFIGKPVQFAAIEWGPPAGQFDMPDGTRVFQWTSVKTATKPATIYASTNPMGIAHGAADFAGGADAVIVGGETSSRTCTHTLFTRWSAEANAYIVTDFKGAGHKCDGLFGLQPR